MVIRAIHASDIDDLRDIHARFYADQFDFPDFFNRFIRAFAIVDDFDRIITVGGILPILECIILTDKSLPARDRVKALNHMLALCKYYTRIEGYPRFHAFAQDPDWAGQLLKSGFIIPKGQILSIEV